MSLASGTDIEGGDFFVSFNQDSSPYRSLAVGSKDGYSLFALDTVDTTLNRIHHSLGEAICLLECLFTTSLVAVVSLENQRKLQLWNYKEEKEICDHNFSAPILAVKMNRSRLVVCCEANLYIHNIRDMEVIHTIDTPPNSAGICALASDCYLAYPGSATTGEVQIFNAAKLQAKTKITAHESPLAALAFSPNGTEVATASGKGTVIRVFSVIDGSKLSEFRRGVQRVSIASLAFSSCSEYLCCSSNTETVHIFKLEYGSPKSNEDQGSKDNWMSYILQKVTGVLTQERDFATAALPVVGPRTSCIITTIQNSLRLLVASETGHLYVYQFPEDGDKSLLLKTHDIGIVEPAPNASSPGSTSNAAAFKNGAAPFIELSNSTVSEDEFEIVNPPFSSFL